MSQYTLTVEEFACWGCKTCEVACQQEYNPIEAAKGYKYISVWEDGPKMVDGKLEFTWRVTVCRHCQEPDCVPACPTEAITKRDDGIVILDQEMCNGCQACLAACTYAAITFDVDKGAAAKCNLCYHRVDQGLYPACADNVCLAHCVYFGERQAIEKIIAAKQSARSA